MLKFKLYNIKKNCRYCLLLLILLLMLFVVFVIVGFVIVVVVVDCCLFTRHEHTFALPGVNPSSYVQVTTQIKL